MDIQELEKLVRDKGLGAAIRAAYKEDTREALEDDGTGDAIAAWEAENSDIEPRGRVLTYANRCYQVDPKWLVHGLIPQVGVGQVFGRDGTGKTYLALSLALSVANPGVDEWFGHKVRLHGDVMYVTMEGSYTFPHRIQAWLQHHEDMNDTRLFTWGEWPLDLASWESTTDFAARVLATDLWGRPVRPVLIVIDTQRLATSGNEDSSEYGKAVASNVRELANGFRAAVLLVHHSGAADERERGTTAIRDACSFQFQLKQVDGKGVSSKVYQTKNKYGSTKGKKDPLFTFSVQFEQLKPYSPEHFALFGLDPEAGLIDRYGEPVIDGYCVETTSIEEAIDQFPAKADLNKVKALFAGKGKPALSETAIRSVLPGDRKSKANQDAFNAIVEAKHLEKVGDRYRLVA
jgi:hypothetical protein